LLNVLFVLLFLRDERPEDNLKAFPLELQRLNTPKWLKTRDGFNILTMHNNPNKR
jgi:hypothetical protein